MATTTHHEVSTTHIAQGPMCPYPESGCDGCDTNENRLNGAPKAHGVDLRKRVPTRMGDVVFGDLISTNDGETVDKVTSRSTCPLQDGPGLYVYLDCWLGTNSVYTGAEHRIVLVVQPWNYEGPK